MSNILWKRLSQSSIWVIPVLFLADDILGTNGYQLTIAGVGIRIVLFCMTCAILGCYCLFVLHKDKMPLLPKRDNQLSLFGILQPLDYIVLFFLLTNFLWATVIPAVIRGERIFALKDFSTMLVLVLYFPVVFLIRTGRLNVEWLNKIVYLLCIILALWHVIMYLGEKVKPGFYKSYYDFIDVISLGTAVRTPIVYGHGITRVVQTTSIFLLMGAFFAVRYYLGGGYWHLLPLLLFVFALCVTYTKSIWFGFVLGLGVYLVLVVLLSRNPLLRKRCASVAMAILLFITGLNFTIFDNSIFSRVYNTVRTEESIGQLEEGEDELLDAKGTQLANTLRAQQTVALLNKWKQSKLLGFGYGSYAVECIRNNEYPFMYESTLPALIMKLGCIGCLIWVVFIVGVTVSACVAFWNNNHNDLFWWIGMAFSYALAVQTNPFLFTFAGFSFLLYLLLPMQKRTKVNRG